MISTTLLTDMPPALMLHLGSAVMAVGLGPIVLYRPRRDRWHKAMGYAWVLSMVVVAASSFWLSAHVLPLAGGFGPIHLLSLWVFYLLYRAVAAARRGDIASHRARMKGLYWAGLMLAGIFTLLPGRLLNRVFFPQTSELALVLIATGALLCLWVTRRPRGPKMAPRRR